MERVLYERIDKVSCNLAKELFRRTNSEAFRRFEEVKHFKPKIVLGPADELLMVASRVLYSIAYAIRTQGEAIIAATNPEDVARLVLRGVADALNQVGESTEAGQATAGLEQTFAEQPSWLDRITEAVLPSFEGKEDRLKRLEQQLEQCLLKIINNERGQDIVSTAFALCEKGHILTAAHVALRYREMNLTFLYKDINGKKVEKRGRAEVRYLDPERDIAVLKADTATWGKFQKTGLRPYRPLAALEADQIRRDPVLCLGYQEQSTFIDPLGVEARVAPHYPKRSVRFRDGHVQDCLVLLIPEGDLQMRIVEGMSGGPILNLRTGEVIGMVTGATRRVLQPWAGFEEEISSAVYGFGVLLSDVAKSWPALEKCCLQDH